MSFLKELNNILTVKEGEPLFKHTTYRIGGNARYYAKPNTEKELISAADFAKKSGVNYLILGNGSKLLVSDKGFNGLVIDTEKLNKITFSGNLVTAECGVKLQSLLGFCVENGLGGAEFLAGIPASVGGAVYMNAGVKEGSVGDITISVSALKEGKKVVYGNAESGFTYRDSLFKEEGLIVLSASFRLRSCDSGKIREKIAHYRDIRANQPLGRSCGSVFKNGRIPSAKLIEGAGLKGYRIGGAVISDKHANFFINDGGATCKDLLELIDYAKKKVYLKYGITLEEEVIFIGEKDDINR